MPVGIGLSTLSVSTGVSFGKLSFKEMIRFLCLGFQIYLPRGMQGRFLFFLLRETAKNEWGQGLGNPDPGS